MPSDQASLPGNGESSGTVAGPDNFTPNSQTSHSSSATPSSKLPTPTPEEEEQAPAEEEQALESHEVIELQTFSERKAWIEDKIKFLEKMPPIEVFVGLDAIRASAEQVPGLPTRAELDQWLVEHDTIEKETEVFDTGELKKLRKITKAATKRNLSPEDTDLIELTLTTIYELDKLLHLLRDRSENLDLLGIRLTWEENRIGAWTDRRQIISDIKAFLDTRARWSPSVYENASESSIPKRRGSIDSVASVASDALLVSPGFSRSTRFKLAEILSRDAAQFSSRVTTLRHGKVAAAGKYLDKLIDSSRKAVPEDLLDEQDRLEEKGINDMENVGKFVMNVVMQWRKADEVYVETMKDQVSAQNLLDEIEMASTQHPTARQSALFVSRADALIKRLALRGNPASSTSTFPSPVHPLFPEQKSHNEFMCQNLSSDVSAALDLARKVDRLAKEYRVAYEAVQRVESLTQTANDLSATFAAVVERLERGVSSTDGDGTPPDLMSEACLNATQHSAFLALLPSILDEHEKASKNARQIIQSSRAAVRALDRPGIDTAFRTNAAAQIDRLIALQGQAERVREEVIGQVNRLREARKIWTAMNGYLRELADIRRDIGEAMEKGHWQQEANRGGTPLTPESLTPASLPVEALPNDHIKQLDDLNFKLTRDIDHPLAALSQNLEAPLREWLSRSLGSLQAMLEGAKQMAHLLESVQRQAVLMGTIREEFNDLQIRIEDMKMRFDSGIEDILSNKIFDEQLMTVDADLKADTAAIREGVRNFTGGLSQRVLFVSRKTPPSPVVTTFIKRRFSSVDLKLGAIQEEQAVELPFDLSSLDDTVRTDANSFAMRLEGELHGLEQKAIHFQVARKAKEVDYALASTIDAINGMVHELSSLQGSFRTIMDQGNITVPLERLSRDLDDSVDTHRSRIARSFSPIRDLLREIDAIPGSHDASVHETLYLARMRAVDDAELKLKTWDEGIQSLRNQISEAQRIEARRIDEERLAEERRLQAEAERLAAEEAERVQRERARLQEEERRRLEEARLTEELRLKVEKERLEAEEAERARLERLRLEEEERRHLEEARRAEELRLQVEQERIAAEEAERARRERERSEMEQKLRLAEAQLAEERRLAAEKAETARLERERLDIEERQRQEEKRLEECRRLEAEKERIAAAEVENARLQRERVEAEEKERARMLENQRLQVERDRVSQDASTRVVAQAKAETHRLGPPRGKEKEGSAKEQLEDVFGLRILPSDSRGSLKPGMRDLQVQILALRKRLRSLSINELARPSSESSGLPSKDQASRIGHEFSLLSVDVARLPISAADTSVDVELRSLRAEIEASVELVKRIQCLANLVDAVQTCDAALSDLLEHIDSYPASPITLTALYRTPESLPPDEQMAARLSFTKSLIDNMSTLFAVVTADSRAVAETQRILQTWAELEEMGKERVGGKKSRPASVVSSTRGSSGRNSSASISSRPSKAGSYSQLSVASPSRPLLHPASQPKARRVISGSTESRSRPLSQLSNLSSSRSVSGPSGGFSLFGSTFASRQRTTSLTGSTASPIRRTSGTPLRSRTATNPPNRTGSPSVSDTSSVSRLNPSRASTSTSTWSRAPRYSLGTLPRGSTPQKKIPQPRKTYIANPKSKLDVAVGDVVNKLPVGISIEGVSESWKDQSGKYWIGDQDPKLCFCRILRSQTVMVRVGGGWTELSKFIKDHFADSFRLLSDSPPRAGGSEEKWISSTTLLEAPEPEATPPEPPRTPEPKGHIPSFSLSTPNGASPQSLKSSPSTKGSPLTPLQFIRRAEPDAPLLRPGTPTKPPTLRTRTATSSNTPARNSIWRP